MFDEDEGRPRTLALFPEDRCEAVAGNASLVRLRLSEMRLCHPRQWGACWLAGQLWGGAAARSWPTACRRAGRACTREGGWDESAQRNRIPLAALDTALANAAKSEGVAMLDDTPVN